MAKISLYLDKRYEHKNGVYPIKLRISNQGKNRYIETNYEVPDSHWDKVTEQITKKTKDIPNVKVANLDLQKKLITAKDAVLNTRYNKFLPVDELKTIILKSFNENVSRDDSFQNICKQQIEALSLKEASTSACYQTALNRINRYTNNQTLYFDTITINWLNNYFQWMTFSEGLKDSSAYAEIKIIRAIFNKALTPPAIISPEIYPFGRYGFKTFYQETEHRSLSKKQFKKLINYKVKPGSRNEIAKDCFILSFLLIGINNKDLYNLKKEDISGSGRLTYKRQKTKRKYDILIPTRALEIINKYKGNGDSLLYFSDKYVDHAGFTRALNTGLKEISNELEFPIKITMYYARHTWATFAAELEIAKETIAAGLGHGKRVTTDIYINFNSKKVDKANKKVIEYAFTLKKKQKS